MASSNVDKVETDNIDEENDKKDELDWDDFVDEVNLKDLELTHKDEDKNVSCFDYRNSTLFWTTYSFIFFIQRLKNEAVQLKEKGNQQFRFGEFRESAITYTLALRTCPISYPSDRSVLYSNRAASKMKLVITGIIFLFCFWLFLLHAFFI